MRSLFKIYSSLINTNNNLYTRATRFFIKRSANLIIPSIFIVSNKRKVKKENIIVSLTTFPERINKTWIVVESILRQTKPPKKIVLTLSKRQFSSENEVPIRLFTLA